MRALTVTPGQADSAAVRDMPEPDASLGDLLVETLAVGVCGTDREIVAAEYGEAPQGEEHLILGHESLGRVREAPAGSAFEQGDLVAGVVRMPDPEPCPSCAVGEWDMCRNGRYTEHGIKGLHGFAAELFRVPEDHLVKLEPSLGHRGVLMEPASVVAKAWEHIERIGNRATWQPRSVLVTGAGPIGLLAALMGQQRGLELHVLDRAQDGPKPDLVRHLGGEYHCGAVDEVDVVCDVVIECTGAPKVIVDVVSHTGNNGIVCLTGVSTAGRELEVDPGAWNRAMVLENDVVFGTVNANRRHYQQGANALAAADPEWLDGMLTRRVDLEDFADALDARPADVKNVLVVAE
jgi:threonine dehydrogenase-like Zn-dependent dehydrogenase